MRKPDANQLAEAIADKLLSEFHEIKVELKKELDELKALLQQQ